MALRSSLLLLSLVMTVSVGTVSTTAAEPLAGAPLVRLWEGDAPGATGKEDRDVPALFLFPAPKETASGAGVVVCPGGGYGGLATDHEGEQVARWLNSIGVHAYVLRYRLGTAGYRHPVMMNDVARAIRTVRARAGEWGNDPHRIGVCGFSAGGHLASTAVTHWDDGRADAADPIERASSRPDWGVMIYPVITMTSPYTHGGSRDNLLGKDPSQDLVDQMSNEKQVNEKTPPCFLVHSVDDGVVPPQNSLMFATALTQHGVPFSLVMLEKGGHGYGLGNGDAALRTWPGQCVEWMRGRGFLAKK